MAIPSDQAPISVTTAQLPSSSSSTVPTSPRLPSPPPPVEDLSNPTSPSFMSNPGFPAPQNTSQLAPNSGNRRIRKGTKLKDINGPPLIPLAELDSAFQLQEHLAALLSSTTNPAGSDHILPLSRKDCDRIASCPDGIDEWMWCYELTRRLTRDLNHLVVGLLSDNCTEETCPEMRASLWQYLCAVHDPPRSCCAMDYSVHTLDHAASTLCSTKHFPSRLNINANGTKQLSSIFRRLYRIFAHAWFLHRGVFWDVENEHGLYVFFRTVSDKYNLIPEDNLTIPSAAFDGTARDDGADFIRANLENKGSEHDSDLEDDLDQDTNDSNGREIPVILNNSVSLDDVSEKRDGSQSKEVTDFGGPMPSEDFPLFVLSREGGGLPVSSRSEELESSGTDAVPLGFQGDTSSSNGHQIELKLDIGGDEPPER
ncbi:hypothetical protein TWF132_009520 [Orbilia oligospora]|nr:hypothetical protein TWF751_012009 [Orbilia oligospora]KAF3235031.1 hypothetical protein TWF128_002141 [Orbilia oligospora]KAF3285114.1 hypothetical protein TWF132_009520 [Orbilia oligospora]